MKHQNNQKTTITYRSGNESLLDDIQALWEGLNRHHRDAAVNFKAHYESYTFAIRDSVHTFPCGLPLKRL